jgi:uncharacterized membrane protein (UPF0127 family)
VVKKIAKKEKSAKTFEKKKPSSSKTVSTATIPSAKNPKNPVVGAAKLVNNPSDIVNLTRSTVLHSAPRWAISSPSQAKGFMFERPSNNAIIFVFSPPQKVSLHMWFVFGEIDVVGLDESYVVVTLKERFAPWAFWSSQVPVSYILELPAGTISATQTLLGDKICLPSLPKR